MEVVTHVSVASAESTDRRRSSVFAPSASLLSEALAACRKGLIQKAAQRGADVVVAMHFGFEWLNPRSGNIVGTSQLAVVAYGTAVRLKTQIRTG